MSARTRVSLYVQMPVMIKEKANYHHRALETDHFVPFKSGRTLKAGTKLWENLLSYSNGRKTLEHEICFVDENDNLPKPLYVVMNVL